MDPDPWWIPWDWIAITVICAAAAAGAGWFFGYDAGRLAEARDALRARDDLYKAISKACERAIQARNLETAARATELRRTLRDRLGPLTAFAAEYTKALAELDKALTPPPGKPRSKKADKPAKPACAPPMAAHAGMVVNGNVVMLPPAPAACAPAPAVCAPACPEEDHHPEVEQGPALPKDHAREAVFVFREWWTEPGRDDELAEIQTVLNGGELSKPSAGV